MIKVIESSNRVELEMLRERKIDFTLIVEEMRSLVQQVRKKGDVAIKQFTKQFENRDLLNISVSQERRKAAKSLISQTLKEALMIAKENIAKFHFEQMPKEWLIEILPGVLAGQIVRPLKSVGCYVPGGKYPLVSTVLMTVIPAMIAKVKEIIVCTPHASPEILFACELCGVSKIFEIGGPMAISAMAYGTETIPKVDKIVGPGNLYVSAAKKIVYGDVGIDFIAGPSEIVIIADEKANPFYIAADLVAQAEHDVTSMALCITPSKELGIKVIELVEKMLEDLPTNETARAALKAKGAIIFVKSLKEAFEVSNFFSPEHLEIQLDDASAWLSEVESAGSIFLGKDTPEAAGDYASGPNHVLPTGGLAAAQSGLSIRDFIKTPTIQKITTKGLRQIAPAIIALAEAEGLAGHAESIKVRVRC